MSVGGTLNSVHLIKIQIGHVRYLFARKIDMKYIISSHSHVNIIS